MNINGAFPSNHLRAADLNGRSFTLLMGDVKMAELDDGEKPALHFQNAEKPLVLNKTNASTIAAIYGEETQNWFGQKIEIYPTETDYQGKRVACIRVRAPQGQQTQQQAAMTAQAPAAAPGISHQQNAAMAGQMPPPGPLDDEIPFAPIRDLP
ncbi:hypothetical protein HBA54_28065 [Pelagibius litoralis]|uniref:Uncharacterized protein n=1 Tax=Pelagibius litoralis TaxID=374515 RepID=A0A967KC12_9PROT|nr:hypothetical protein [Pelagibius litoralis]NIA72448.1 hypothetical protein [Pelagibius litoralis]